MSVTKIIAKATCDLLMNPDWTLNVQICDSINSSLWRAKDVVKAVRSRLRNKKPRVQYLTLTLLDALMKNCGDLVHFHVADCNIPKNMVVIFKKQANVQVKVKILVLLETWQEAFGGSEGFYPPYYKAYFELKKSGIGFSGRSSEASLISTAPSINWITGCPSGLYGLNPVHTLIEVLNEMLKEMDIKHHRKVVKDNVIVDLVKRCRSNLEKIEHLISSTRKEELAEAIKLKGYLQYVVDKHEAMASGSPMPTFLPEIKSTSKVQSASKDESKRENSSLAFRTLKKNQIVPSPSSLDKTNADASSTMCASKVDLSSYDLINISTGADPPGPTKTQTKEQDMIELLSIIPYEHPSPECSPIHQVASKQNDIHISCTLQNRGNPFALLPEEECNNYAVPWARQNLLQPLLQPHDHLLLQNPKATDILSVEYLHQASRANAYSLGLGGGHSMATRPAKQQISFASGPLSKPLIHHFGDLIDLGGADGVGSLI